MSNDGSVSFYFFDFDDNIMTLNPILDNAILVGQLK